MAPRRPSPGCQRTVLPEGAPSSPAEEPAGQQWADDSGSFQNPGGTRCAAYKTFCHPEDGPKNALRSVQKEVCWGAGREELDADVSRALPHQLCR